MVKSGKFFSIFVVLTLLILLAPAVILAPVGNVSAADGGNVTQEVAGSLSFSESSPGGWWNFTAGSQGVNVTYGLYLAQYTRADVTRATVVPDCGFRNYTTGNGTVTGNLSGTINLSWLTFDFNTTYPYTPKYNATLFTATDFGFMMGRGHFYNGTNPNNNFTFVWVLDFDSQGRTIIAGKGFLLSVAESGTFVGHKIIGDFEISRNGGAYTGTYNLRIYDPSEIQDLGDLNVTGGVVQEVTDPIRYELDILDFNTDGPQLTPANVTTDFEEVGWGKDLPKNVTSGRLGINGVMDVARNTALYLELLPSEPPNGWVRIMGTTANNIYINDTNAGVRYNDGSPYGELWELLLLFIPNQHLQLGGNFTQGGYTFTPFGMLNPSTQWYAGEENYALATILIESSLTNAKQWSVDHSYGLYPHPKVDSVIPDSGLPGTTMSVTITGKYFLRANGAKSGWVNNSGNVSFGEGIKVNSYTINTNNPIGNSITANITIDPAADEGVRDVNVTSCFGYASGNGTTPYRYGHGVFNVSSETGTLKGQVSFKRKYSAGNSTWVTPIVVRFFNNKVEAGFSPINVTTDAYGNFTVPGVGVGTWDVSIKNFTALSRMSLGKAFTAGNDTTINFTTTGVLNESDTDNDDRIRAVDFNRILTKYWLLPDDPSLDPACMYDFDRSGRIDAVDFNLVLTKYNQKGDLYNYLLP